MNSDSSMLRSTPVTIHNEDCRTPVCIHNEDCRSSTINNLDLSTIELIIHISPATEVVDALTENEPDEHGRTPSINERVGESCYLGNPNETSNGFVDSGRNGSICKPLQIQTCRRSRIFSLVDQFPIRRSTLTTANHLRSRSRSLSVGALRRAIKVSTSNELKATKTLGVIMGAFTACWLPFFILALVRPFCGEQSECIPRWLTGLLLWLGYANSLLNPIIYARFNRDFRTPFRHILQCHLRDINERLRSDNYTEQYGAGVTSVSVGAVVARSNSVACSNWLLQQHRPRGSAASADGL